MPVLEKKVTHLEHSKEIKDYFPQYSKYKVIPIFSSQSISQDMVKYLTKNGIYTMAMKDNTLEILNQNEIEKKR